ncbi:MAG: hypothetical protein KAG98_04745 [Lentisphaeria bacterium]|nr:hypothetical protein [Lentisphaeria bacterium]
MSIGIGGAGSKLASMLDHGRCTAVNVSESELNKVEATNRVLAVTHSTRGQFRGAGRNPEVGRTAFVSVQEEITAAMNGNLVLTSTGGGTGNGITSVLLEKVSAVEDVPLIQRTMFGFVLPYVEREAPEHVENTISFLKGPVSDAIDSGNTGNMVLFSNRFKFEARITELESNRLMTTSLQNFLNIPYKGDKYELLDGHIDHEDFKVYKSKPYFNHFTQFFYDTDRSFAEQLKENFNQLLLAPERTIEAMFLLEVPTADQAPMLYNVLDFFAEDDVNPAYGVILNPDIQQATITVSLLYSRKPRELVKDFKAKADSLTRKRLKKSLEQFVKLETVPFDVSNAVRELTQPRETVENPAAPTNLNTIPMNAGAPVAPAIDDDHVELPTGNEDVMNVLKRLKKLK